MTARLDLDYEDVKSGFQTGKAASLSDWAFRKEQESFEKLVATLRATKWNRAHPEERRAISKRHYEKPGTAERQLAWAKARRRKRHDATVHTCEGCGTQWCRVPGTRGLAGVGKFCTAQCRNRHRYATDPDYAEQRRREQRERYARSRES